LKKQNLLFFINNIFYTAYKSIFICLIIFPVAYAEDKPKDLMMIYQEALKNDALLSSARIQNKATKELIDQGISLFLPNINLNAGYDDNRNKRKILTSGIDNDLLSGKSADFESYDYGVTITQPIFNYANYSQYKQNIIQTNISDKQLILSQQELIFRVAKVYFEALMARDKINLFQSQKAEIQAQLSEAEVRFEMGLISITDINEAKTKAALINVEQINAIQELKIKKREIESITNSFPGKLKPLNHLITFIEIDNLVDEWIAMGLENNLELQIKNDEVLIADREIDIRKGNRYPRIDAIASRSRGWDKGGYPYGTTKNKGTRSFSDTIGLEINIPIYSGGYKSSRVREGELLKLKLKEDLKYLKRKVELKVRENYLNLQSNFSEIEAYQQALISSKTTLESNSLGFQVGLRNSIDVLIAQQVYFDVEKDMLEARYNYLMNLIRLKMSVGMLTRNDLDEINNYLVIK